MRRILFAAAMVLALGGCMDDDGTCPDLISEPTMPGLVSEPTMPSATDEDVFDPCASQQPDDDDQISEPCGPSGCGATVVVGVINEPVGP